MYLDGKKRDNGGSGEVGLGGDLSERDEEEKDEPEKDELNEDSREIGERWGCRYLCGSTAKKSTPTEGAAVDTVVYLYQRRSHPGQQEHAHRQTS